MLSFDSSFQSLQAIPPVNEARYSAPPFVCALKPEKRKGSRKYLCIKMHRWDPSQPSANKNLLNSSRVQAPHGKNFSEPINKPV
jgi:hypothetical protein